MPRDASGRVIPGSYDTYRYIHRQTGWPIGSHALQRAATARSKSSAYLNEQGAEQPTRRLTRTKVRLPDRPQDGEAGIRKAIAERFPDVLPDKLDEVYQSWLAFAKGQGGQPDLEQFFQQYEADAQENPFEGGEVNPELPPEIQDRIREGQGNANPYPEEEARRGRWPGSDPDLAEGWDGKIYRAGGEGEPDTVVAEGLRPDPVHYTPQGPYGPRPRTFNLKSLRNR